MISSLTRSFTLPLERALGTLVVAIMQPAINPPAIQLRSASCRLIHCLTLACHLLSGDSCSAQNSAPPSQTAAGHFNVVVYSATTAGTAAALAAASAGCTVLLAEPASHDETTLSDDWLQTDLHVLTQSPRITFKEALTLKSISCSPSGTQIQLLTFRTAATSPPVASDYCVSCDVAIDATADGALLMLGGERIGEPGNLRARERGTHGTRGLLHADSIACSGYGSLALVTDNEGSQKNGTTAVDQQLLTPPLQIPFHQMLSRTFENLLVPVAANSASVGIKTPGDRQTHIALGRAAGTAAAQASHSRISVRQVDVPTLQRQLTAAGSAVIYVSDVPPGHPDFAAVQWWGLQGGLHSLPMPPSPPESLSRYLSGQPLPGFPGHAAELQRMLDADLARRWHTLAVMAGLPPHEVPLHSEQITRGDFIREVHRRIMQVPPSQATAATQPHAAPRMNPLALPSTHAPGDVDNPALVPGVLRNVARLPGIIVDDCDAELQGEWQYSTHTPPWAGSGYLHDRNEGKGLKSVTYRPRLPIDGVYEVRLSHCRNIRRSTNTLVLIHHSGGETSLRINQQELPEHDGLFRTLGRFHFRAGQEHWLRISNADTAGKYVIADAVQWLPVAAP